MDHCNLRCAECTALAPYAPESLVDPAVLERDLRLLGRALRPHVLTIGGGEPLLHPEIVRCLEAARASGIARSVSLGTNGFLAPRVAPEVWRLVDRVVLSLFTSVPLPDKAIALVRARCEESGAKLVIKPFRGFQKMNPDTPHVNGGARHAWDSCDLRVRGHTLHGGRFYLCGRPPHLAPYLGTRGVAVAPEAEADGVAVDAPDLPERLRAYLERRDPLASCTHCLGGTGPREPHVQLRLR